MRRLLVRQCRAWRLASAAAALATLACTGAPSDRQRGADTARLDTARPADGAARAPLTDASTGQVIGPGSPRSFRWTLLDSASFDADGDGTPERIELSATVEVDARGRPLWEDGHQWLVLVRDDSVTYPLVDRFVPWGGVSFWAVHNEQTGQRVIVVQASSLFGPNGGTRVEQFAFDRARGGFVRAGVIEAAGTAVYRAPPGMSALLPPAAPARR